LDRRTRLTFRSSLSFSPDHLPFLRRGVEILHCSFTLSFPRYLRRLLFFPLTESQRVSRLFHPLHSDRFSLPPCLAHPRRKPVPFLGSSVPSSLVKPIKSLTVSLSSPSSLFQDNPSALHLPTIRRWDLIMRIWTAEYLGLQPVELRPSSTRRELLQHEGVVEEGVEPTATEGRRVERSGGEL